MTFEVMRPKYVGARVQRKEDPRLLSGSGRYAADVQPTRALHVAILRSDHAHALIRSINLDLARAMPGVIDVIDGEALASELKPLYATSRMPGYKPTALWPLARDRVRYVGEPVVAVVATDRYLAEDARAAIQIEYAALPAVTDANLSLTAQSDFLHPEHGSNLLVSRNFSRGNIEQAISEAFRVVSGQYRFTRTTPVAIEPRAYTAEWDRRLARLTLHSATQAPGIIRDALAEVLDLNGPSIRVLAADVGGGFGGKVSLYPEEVIVSFLAQKLKRSVKYVSDRQEDLISTTQAFDQTVKAEMALDASGRILGIRASILGDAGAYSIYPWTAALEPMQIAGFLPGPYQVPSYEADVQVVATNKTPSGPYRGVGRPGACFILERLIDKAAKEFGIDPLEFRRKNLVQPDQFPYKTGSGIVWDKSGFIECLDLAAEVIDYTTLKDNRDAAKAAGRWFGIGIASYAELTGLGSRMSAAPGMPINTGTESASVEIDATGSVIATFGTASIGQGLETTLAQIVADEIGVRPEDVTIVHGDSAAITHSTGSYASRSTVLAGGAAHKAGKEVREKLLKAAGFLMDCELLELEIEDGVVRQPATNKVLSFKDIGRAVYSEMGRFPLALRQELDLRATSFYDPEFGTTTSATHIATVDIDPETFEVRVLRYVAAEDCGRVINPQIVEGQVQGGVAQGIGVALMEEVIHDPQGQIFTASLVDYLVPSAAEVPSIEAVHLEALAAGTIGGYRGMGEGGTIGAPAAVANAIADALSHLNIDITELPATPERLFRLVTTANQEKA
ncbi:MAG: xanthine dehydrogenase family protein molybdopterin-binding subunit [Rhodospirillales bacterium]